MKNPFGRGRYSSGTYSPEVMELAHGLPLQDREGSDKRQDSHSTVSSKAAVGSGTTESTSEIQTQNTTLSATDGGSSTVESISEISTQNTAPSTTDAGSSSTIESISEISTQNTTPSTTGASSSSTVESISEISTQNITPPEAGDPDKKAKKKSVWYRFFSKLLCLGSGENESDAEIYHPTQQVDEQDTSSHDQEAVQQNIAEITPSEDAQEIPDDRANAADTNVEHSRSASDSPKKRSLLYRFFARLFCLGSGENEPEVVTEHDSPDSLQRIPNPLDSDAETYVPFERCDEDISSIRVKSDTPSIEEASIPSSSQPIQDINVHVEHNTPSTDEVETPSKLLSELDTTSEQPLKRDSSKLQPITQLKKQRPVSHYHISPATDVDASTSYSTANRIRDTQTPPLLRDNPNGGVSFSQLRKSFKTDSARDISTICGSATPDAQGTLQHKSTSLPNLHSVYLPSGRTIECTYNVPTNDALLQKTGNIQDLSAVGKATSASKKSKGNVLRSSHSSLTIHEEHEQLFSADVSADVRSAMRKINRSRFSETSQDALSKKRVSFAEKIFYAPCATRSDSAISKIISLFEEKSGTASQNLPKDLPNTMRR